MTITDLIEKLEKAEGPDRELDAQLWLATSPGVTRNTQHVASATGAWPPYDIDETRDETGRLITVPAYTTSLDAAVALAERVLPGWSGIVDFGHDSPMRRADIYGPVKEIGEDEYGAPVEIRDYSDGEAPTPALALCLAILKAIQEHRP